MQTTGQPVKDAGPEIRLRTLRILWAVSMVTIGIFVLVTRFGRMDEGLPEEGFGPIQPLLYVFGALAVVSVIASFVIKANFYRRAAEQQQPPVLQQGFIIAMVLCEVAALLGVMGIFGTWNDYAYALLALGALGEALHFPRREQLMSAYFKPVM
jgi:hypothetical protein